MARYTAAVCRLCRRSGEKLMLKGSRCITKCAFEKRPKAPGPQVGRARRLSDRGQQIRDKQKVKQSYGLLERQFVKTFKLAAASGGITGDNLLILLERRLDNVVYRMGFAESRSQARQLVNHGHITVNGRKLDIASYFVNADEIIGVRSESMKSTYFKNLKDTIESKAVAPWIGLDRSKLEARIISLPAANAIDAKLNASAVVEYYSR